MSKKIIATCDCETDPFQFDNKGNAKVNIKPFVWGYYNGKKYREFESTLDFVNDIKHRKWDFYAHNGGKFDFIFLLDYVEEAQEIKIINGRVSKFKIGFATFYDSYNILPVPLSKLSKDNFDYNKLHEDVRHMYKDDISKYLKSDCVNLYNHVKDLFSRYEKRLTIASSAMKEFENVVDKMPTSKSDYHDKFKEYYYGGRVSHFELGVIEAQKDESIKIYDINSAYPTAMLYEHPYTCEYIELDCLPDNVEDIQKCFIELECYSQGCFCYRVKNGGLEFEHTKRVWKVTGWEYIAGIETGTISDIKIIKVYMFVGCRSFEEYVNKFYSEKLIAKDNGDKSGYLMAKLYLNSVYGKFAQDERKYKNYMFLESEDAFNYLLYGSIDGEVLNGEYVEEHHLDVNNIDRWQVTKEYSNGMVLIESENDKTFYIKDNEGIEKGDSYKFYNVATASSITGWVRAYMWKSICKVDRPLYCDTDSIACFNGDNLDLGKKLGQWDCELDNIYKMAIGGKKLYCAFSRDKKDGKDITKKACKGVDLSPIEIEKVARGEEVLYKKISPVFSVKSNQKALLRYVNRKDKKDENLLKRKFA